MAFGLVGITVFVVLFVVDRRLFVLFVLCLVYVKRTQYVKVPSDVKRAQYVRLFAYVPACVPACLLAAVSLSLLASSFISMCYKATAFNRYEQNPVMGYF